MNHSLPSTSKILYLEKNFYPNDACESYYITAEEVRQVLNQGLVPDIRLHEQHPGPDIAVILAQDKHPDRQEEDYALHDTFINAIINAGGNPRFVGFDNVYEQLELIKPKAIYLVGGCFRLPPEWCDGFVMEGSDRRANAYREMLKYAQEYGLPTLGICAGEQMLAGFGGAKLINHINDGRAPQQSHCQGGSTVAHKVKVKPGSLLYWVTRAEEFATNSDHNQTVHAEKTGECIVTAWAEDGIVEAVELKHPWHHFVLGVQWHPECFAAKGDVPSLKIFEAFIKAARGFVIINENSESFEEADLVEISGEDFIIDLMYTRKENLCGIDAYNRIGFGNRAFVRRELWKKLQKTIPWLRQKGLKMKICDAYRPPLAHMELKKAIHEDGPGMFCSRPVISKHCHGTAIDVVLVDASGRELKYPTPVDCYDEKYARQIQAGQKEAFYEYAKQGSHSYQNPAMAEEIANREELRQLMEGAGFTAYRAEWWHWELGEDSNLIYPMVEYMPPHNPL